MVLKPSSTRGTGVLGFGDTGIELGSIRAESARRMSFYQALQRLSGLLKVQLNKLLYCRYIDS